MTLPSIATVPAVELEGLLQFIDACANAVDGPALIKATIESHLDALQDIHIENLLYRTPHGHSVFSILIKNPYFVEWLFGMEIHVVDVLMAGVMEQVDVVEPVAAMEPADAIAQVDVIAPVQPALEDVAVEVVQPVDNAAHARVLAFKQRVSQPLAVLTTAILRSEKTAIALESLLNESGSLFFWLFYFQQDPEREALFKAILSFIFELHENLASYDSLMPIFYDMQRSTNVAVEDKTLVKTFLHARMKEQLRLGNTDDFWRIARNLVTLDNEQDILTMLSENLELFISLNKPVNRAIFHILVHDEACLVSIGQRLSQQTALIEAPLAQDAAPRMALSTPVLGEVGFFSQPPVTQPLVVEPALNETDGNLDADVSSTNAPE